MPTIFLCSPCSLLTIQSLVRSIRSDNLLFFVQCPRLEMATRALFERLDISVAGQCAGVCGEVIGTIYT